jgi:hypothetical protein
MFAAARSLMLALSVVSCECHVTPEPARWSKIADSMSMEFRSLRPIADELRDLCAYGKNQGAVSHLPTVRFARGHKSTEVFVEIAAKPEETGDTVDFIWASDAGTGEIIAARKIIPTEKGPRLLFLVERGRRIRPSLHRKSDGVWEGETLVVTSAS